jgi:hypothetical protein
LLPTNAPVMNRMVFDPVFSIKIKFESNLALSALESI